MMTPARPRGPHDAYLFRGSAAPTPACQLARATHRRTSCFIYESARFGPTGPAARVHRYDPSENRLTCGDRSRNLQLLASSPADSVRFLGAAQIDNFGNINTTVITRRLPPSPRPAARPAAPRNRRVVPQGSGGPAKEPHSFGPVDFVPRSIRDWADPGALGLTRRRPPEGHTDLFIPRADPADVRSHADVL